MHRILHVITPSRMAGAETLLARLAARQQARGNAVNVLCSRRAGIAGQLASRGIEVHSARLSGKANPLALVALSRAIWRYHATVLHSHLSTASWWCGWMEQIAGPPSLGHVHGFTRAAWHRRQRMLLAVSHAVKEHLVGQGIDAGRVRVLHNPVDPEDVKPSRPPCEVRAELATETDAPVVGTFAHFSEKKGWRDLVEAAARVVRQFPAAVFWFVGDGPLRPEIVASVHELGIAANVRCPGFRSDAADLMNAVDIMALPSHREPFGLVYVEAALLGKPVIACDCGGAPEVVSGGETGLLVPPHRPGLLAEAIGSMLTNRGEAESMGRRGRDQALDRFGWRKYLDGLEMIYEELQAPCSNSSRVRS
jgi:glycosyltransferase involved in cell wall biosynthesis